MGESTRVGRSSHLSGLARCWTPAIVLLLLLLMVGLIGRTADACSCQLQHPQQHYCSAHYVITARIRGVRSDEFNNYYRIKVNKVFKATEKAMSLLVNKEIVSPIHDSMCGVKLEKGQTYLIAGRLMEAKMFLSICDFHSEWGALSVKQKKGFKLLYEKGCGCKVAVCPWWNRDNCMNTSVSQCAWDTYKDNELDCQGKESICMRQPGAVQEHVRCGWNRSTKFRHCLKLRKEKKERQRALEP